MKQTAVEWLDKELESYGDPGYCKLDWQTLDSLIQQAKEKEKEQIIDAFTNEDNIQWDRQLRTRAAEQYYNETYKQD